MDPRIYRRDPFELRVFPDLAIRVAAREVEDFDGQTIRPIRKEQAPGGSLFELVVAMQKVMIAHRGVGLAAPQVGVARRIVTFIDANPGKGKEAVYAVCNPRIVKATGEETAQEGCLSLPGLQVQVPRATYIEVEAQDTWGEPMEFHADGHEARVLQHEIDHLDGVLIVDYLPKYDRSRALLALFRMHEQLEAAIV